jgi:hypothetical protein
LRFRQQPVPKLFVRRINGPPRVMYDATRGNPDLSGARLEPGELFLLSRDQCLSELVKPCLENHMARPEEGFSVAGPMVRIATNCSALGFDGAGSSHVV